MNTKPLLIVTTLIEVGAGLALIAAPSWTAEVLLGEGLTSAPALLVGRIAGAALIAIGLACWLGKNSERGGMGLVAGMLVYNGAVPGLLLHGWFADGLDGIGLWPASVLHLAMGIWCALCLRPIGCPRVE